MNNIIIRNAKRIIEKGERDGLQQFQNKDQENKIESKGRREGRMDILDDTIINNNINMKK